MYAIYIISARYYAGQDNNAEIIIDKRDIIIPYLALRAFVLLSSEPEISYLFYGIEIK